MRNGWKFLSPDGCTYYNGVETVYPLPRPGEKWGPWFEHPDPAQADDRDCGPGRWHVMTKPSAQYAPSDWWAWFVQAENIIGESSEKFSCTRLRLRRVSRATFARMIRLGWMRGANLTRANLSYADLRDAYLTGADLTDAYLRGANLTRANLSYADLRDAYLTGADLTDAYLRDAYLRDAYLRDAYLRDADLTGADLRGANLTGADLTGADLTGADLTGADLTGAEHCNHTRWPVGLDAAAATGKQAEND